MKVNHIHPDFRHVAAYENSDRISFIKQPRWIGYPKANEVIELMLELMKSPQKSRMDNLLIVGDPNNGKTTIIEHFTKLHGETTIDSNSEPNIPVLLAQSPPLADIKGLFIAILERFSAQYRATDSVSKLLYQVIHLMRYCHVKILIIDELHSMLSGTVTKQREVMNAIKSLCNELKIPIVVVGTHDAIQMLHHDSQHASRFDVIQLKQWELNSEFQSLLKSFESTLPLQEQSKLYLPDVARLLHSLSDGNIGNLHQLLIKCATLAIKNNSEKITVETIKSVTDSEISERYSKRMK